MRRYKYMVKILSEVTVDAPDEWQARKLVHNLMDGFLGNDGATEMKTIEEAVTFGSYQEIKVAEGDVAYEA